jgi:Synergist-CTERM protein sorting domain-containing protein
LPGFFTPGARKGFSKEYARFPSPGHVRFWKEEFGLNKRFLKLFALIAAIVLTLGAGGAWAQFQIITSTANDANSYNFDTIWPITFGAAAAQTFYGAGELTAAGGFVAPNIVTSVGARGLGGQLGQLSAISGGVTYSGSILGSVVAAGANVGGWENLTFSGYPLAANAANYRPNPLPGLALQLIAPAGATLTIAPATGRYFGEVLPTPTTAAGTRFPVQVIVNPGAGNTGTVVMRASNNDNPTATAGTYTNYFGGTVVERGRLAVTRNNSLGQSWVGLLSAPTAAAGATLTVQMTDQVQLGVSDPTGAPTVQPLYLLSQNTPRVAAAGAGGTMTNNPANVGSLVYATIDVDQLNGKAQTLRLNHGLDQRLYTPAVPAVSNMGNGAGLAGVYVPPSVAGRTNFQNIDGLTPGFDSRNLDVLATLGYSAYTFQGAEAVYGGLGNAGATPPAWGLATVPIPGGDTFTLDSPAFHRLVKTGIGTLYIGSDGTPQATNHYTATHSVATNAAGALGGAPFAAGNAVRVPGAWHTGGTDVEGGALQVDGENASAAADHFKASLGRIWPAPLPAPAGAYNPNWFVNNAIANGFVYNPLSLTNDGKVIVNRSQFFTDFNGTAGTSFTANAYSLANVNYKPQIAITLNRNDSRFDGKLAGTFDLVLDSAAAGSRAVAGSNANAPVGLVGTANPGSWSPSAAVVNWGQATLTLGNTDNEIVTGFNVAAPATLISNGVLNIAGARSIGPGTLTVGTDAFDTGGAPLAGTGSSRGFLTANAAVFAGLADITIPNVTTVNETGVTPAGVFPTFGALAAAEGAKLSFADVTLNNDHLLNEFIAINPLYVTQAVAAGAVADLFPRDWTGTVSFGSPASADAQFYFAGVQRNPTTVYVERGVWELLSFPTRTAAQTAANENGFAVVRLFDHNEGNGAWVGNSAVPNSVGTLSLGEGFQDWSPYLDVEVADDSRIRVVLLDANKATSRVDAQSKPAAFTAHNVDFNRLGQGQNFRDKRLQIEVDLSVTGTLPVDTYIPLIRSATSAKGWNSLHFLREYSDGHTEDYPKVTVSFPGYTDFDKDEAIEVYLNQDTWEIGIRVLKPMTPPTDPSEPEPTPLEPGLKIASVSSTTGSVTVNVTYADEAGAPLAGKSVVVSIQTGTAAPLTRTVTTGADGKASYTFEGLAANTEYKVVAADATDESVIVEDSVSTKPATDPTDPVDPDPDPTPPAKKSGGGGCDAGFAGLALLLAAPLFLRKKD